MVASMKFNPFVDNEDLSLSMSEQKWISECILPQLMNNGEYVFKKDEVEHISINVRNYFRILYNCLFIAKTTKNCNKDTFQFPLLKVTNKDKLPENGVRHQLIQRIVAYLSEQEKNQSNPLCNRRVVLEKYQGNFSLNELLYFYNYLWFVSEDRRSVSGNADQILISNILENMKKSIEQSSGTTMEIQGLFYNPFVTNSTQMELTERKILDNEIIPKIKKTGRYILKGEKIGLLSLGMHNVLLNEFNCVILPHIKERDCFEITNKTTIHDLVNDLIDAEFWDLQSLTKYLSYNESRFIYLKKSMSTTAYIILINLKWRLSSDSKYITASEQQMCLYQEQKIKQSEWRKKK